METVFAPGCALKIYKPHLAEQLQKFLDKPEYLTCCRHSPDDLNKPTEIINVCSGCDRRYRSLYDGISTISLWQILADSDFSFPDYGGVKMTIHDACPTRTEERVHIGARKLLERMNIEVVEPPHTRTKAKCCGDSLHGNVPLDEVLKKQKERADEMPCDDVVVYCVSCIKSMHNGGKKPRYLVDLLFKEDTIPGETNPDKWHEQVNAFIDEH